MAGVRSLILTCLSIMTVFNAANASYYCNHRWTTKAFYETPTSVFHSISLKGSEAQNDLLVHDSTNDYSISESIASGTFTDHDDMKIGDYCTATEEELHVADIDGDSRDDLLCNKADGTFLVKYYMNGNKFSSEKSIAKGFRCLVDTVTPTNRLLIGDFDGNNADDIMCVPIVGTTLAAGSQIFFNGACPKNFHYSERHDYSRGHGNEPMRRPSMHYHKNSHSHGRDYKKNQCSRDFPKTYTLPVGSLDKCNVLDDTIKVGDSNGDGRDDINCQSKTDNKVYTYLSLGHATGSIFSTLPTSVSDAAGCTFATHTIELADVDGDDDDDLVCVNKEVPTGATGSLEVSYFANNKYSTWDTIGTDCDPTDFCVDATGGYAVSYIVGDFNRDGKDDLMCRYSDGTDMYTETVFAE